jgi:hypothetical protein
MSFAGTWNLTITSPMGKQQVKLEVTVDASSVAGTASLGSDTAPLLDPVLDGDRLRYSVDITKPMKLTLKFDLIRAGDTLQGTAKAGFFVSAEVTGARAVAA